MPFYAYMLYGRAHTWIEILYENAVCIKVGWTTVALWCVSSAAFVTSCIRTYRAWQVNKFYFVNHLTWFNWLHIVLGLTLCDWFLTCCSDGTWYRMLHCIAVTGYRIYVIVLPLLGAWQIGNSELFLPHYLWLSWLVLKIGALRNCSLCYCAWL